MVRDAAEWNEEDQIAVGRVESLGRLEAYVYDASETPRSAASRNSGTESVTAVSSSGVSGASRTCSAKGGRGRRPAADA